MLEAYLGVSVAQINLRELVGKTLQVNFFRDSTAAV